MVGWTIRNLWSRIFVLLMQNLSLYLQFYDKSNFNIFTRTCWMFYVTIMYTKNNNTKLLKTMDGLEFEQ